MLERLAARFGAYLVRTGVAKEDDRDVVCFGLFRVMADVEQIVILAVVAAILRILPSMGALLICYGGLRRHIGGAHAKTHGGCLAAYTTAATAAALLASSCSVEPGRWSALLLPVVTVVLVFVRAPMMHPNSPKSIAMLACFKRLGRIVAVVELAILAPCAVLVPAWLLPVILGGSMGGCLAAATLLLPIQCERGDGV